MSPLKKTILALLCSGAAAGHAALVTPEQQLQVDFRFDGRPAEDVEVLLFDFYSLGGLQLGFFPPGASFTATLMDGDTALGTATAREPVPSYRGWRHFDFASATSPYRSEGAAFVDFSPLAQGPWAGSIVIRSSQAYNVEIPASLGGNFQFHFCRYESPNACAFAAPFPYATSYSISSAVPEPSPLVFLGLGLPVLALCARRRAAR